MPLSQGYKKWTTRNLKRVAEAFAEQERLKLAARIPVLSLAIEMNVTPQALRSAFGRMKGTKHER